MKKLIARHTKAVEKFEMDLRSHELYWTGREAHPEVDDICEASIVLLEKHRYKVKAWRKRLNFLKIPRS